MLSKATAWLSLAAAAVATAGSPSSGAHTLNAGGGLTVHIVGDEYTIMVDGEIWLRSGSGDWNEDAGTIGAGGASYLGLPLTLAGVRAAIPSTNYTHGLTLSWWTRGAGVKVPFETMMLANAAAPGTLVRITRPCLNPLSPPCQPPSSTGKTIHQQSPNQ